MKYRLAVFILALLGILTYISYTSEDEKHNELISDQENHRLRKYDPYTDFESYKQYKKQRKLNGFTKSEAPELYALIERQRRTPNDLTQPAYPDNYLLNELRTAKRRSFRKSKEDLNFIERGPANVAGRTRALLILPNDTDNKTWLAGSASGGIWKTTDAGASWIEKTSDLPNLGTNTLAMSPSDPNTIYAGTGEHFTRSVDGNGMFKSTDQGETWAQIVEPSDYEAFRNVSRIIVDPDDSSVIIATTRNSVFADSLKAAIYKSINGGRNWIQLLTSDQDRYDDLAYNPQNFNTIYTAVQSKGVLKSTDGGETWINRSEGLKILGRIEIGISSIDTSIIWAFAEGGESGTGSDLYFSNDGANSWNLVLPQEEDPIDFFSDQGWYDNVVEAHPFDPDAAYIGGIDVFKIDLLRTIVKDVSYDIEDRGAFQFLSFVNGTQVGGGIFEGNVSPDQVPSIELRFGEGGQMAHRFIVNGRGSGVQPSGYFYEDLVQVPFQVWDIDNNRQLMVSFRDQQEDGEWTLKPRMLNAADTENDTREYIFIHNVTYADTANLEIAKTGGTEFRQLYLMWPVLIPGEQFDPNSTVAKSFAIFADVVEAKGSDVRAITDAYNQYNGNNSFSRQEFAVNEGHHPDQHSITFVVADTISEFFRLLTTNDGGVYLSNIARNPAIDDGQFTYSGFGYNTTQFYGADKRPGHNQYIGGMQDNGTWMSPSSVTDPDKSTYYTFELGGDGFEVIWNNKDPDLILGSIQFNSFRRSSDGGQTWDPAITGLNDDGPFISRLANHRSLPDRVFTIGSSGVWKSNDFGTSWNSRPIGSFWSFRNTADIEVSPANPAIIWAGGALDAAGRLFVSTDGGESFNHTDFYKEEKMGTISGIGLHPEEDSTAYVLFSFASRPKVLKSTDLGQNWFDISGFDNGEGSSSRGFPDVAVKCLLVFPNDPNRIWVGTEIGIVESLDGGNSWNFLESNLPNVNVYDMKIQDDQIVLATYGRGIWSVQIDGIQQKIIFPPELVKLTISPNDKVGLEVISANEFDSLQIFADNNYLGSIQSNIPEGSSILSVLPFALEDGIYDFTITGYQDGRPYRSLVLRSPYFLTLQAVDEYYNDFEDQTTWDEFISEGFSIQLENGFTDVAIHSDHNYRNMMEITSTLKRPFIVREEQSFHYKDVVVVETGEPGAPFGTENFFDYVVVEGTKDGFNWIPLTDGYDSSFDPSWEVAFTSENVGTDELYVDHEIDLKQTFAISDTLLIRFRLFADPFVTGWGWAIDNVELRNLSTNIEETDLEEVIIYPNPTSDFLNINIPRDKKVKRAIIRDMSGKVIISNMINDNVREIRMDLSNCQSGLYLVEIYNNGGLLLSDKLMVTK